MNGRAGAGRAAALQDQATKQAARPGCIPIQAVDCLCAALMISFGNDKRPSSVQQLVIHSELTVKVQHSSKLMMVHHPNPGNTTQAHRSDSNRLQGYHRTTHSGGLARTTRTSCTARLHFIPFCTSCFCINGGSFQHQGHALVLQSM
jgi:hypothetical protein